MLAVVIFANKARLLCNTEIASQGRRKKYASAFPSVAEKTLDSAFVRNIASVDFPSPGSMLPWSHRTRVPWLSGTSF